MELSVPQRYLGQLMVIFHEDLLHSSILPVAPLNLTRLIGSAQAASLEASSDWLSQLLHYRRHGQNSDPRSF